MFKLIDYVSNKLLYFIFLLYKWMFMFFILVLKLIWKVLVHVICAFESLIADCRLDKCKKQYSKMYFDMDCIDEMSGSDFEIFVSYNILPNLGFKNIVKTQDSADFGVDIVAEKNNEKYAIQCKRYSDVVGVHAVQEVVGGKKYYDCDKCVVITNSHYSSAAKKLAIKNDVWLIDRTGVESVEINIYNNVEKDD